MHDDPVVPSVKKPQETVVVLSPTATSDLLTYNEAKTKASTDQKITLRLHPKTFSDWLDVQALAAVERSRIFYQINIARQVIGDQAIEIADLERQLKDEREQRCC